MIKLWLDDIRPAPAGWTWVKTVNAAAQLLAVGHFDKSRAIVEASLDHDLGENEPTGYDLVKWMAETGFWPETKPRVHSANPPGAENMRATIDRYWRSDER